MANIFREDNVKKMSEPERLDRYVKVPSPYTWGILAALIIFLAGFIIWGFTGEIDTETPCTAVVRDGKLTACIKEDEIGELNKGSEVKVKGMTFTVTGVSPQAGELSEVMSQYVNGADTGDIGYADESYYEFYADCSGLSDGVYRAKAVTDIVCPADFVFD